MVLFQTRRTALTGYSVRLHLEAGDVVPGDAVALGAHAAPPGAHGGVSPSLVDLVGDHLQVPEGRLVLSFGLRQLGLPLVHVLLQVLEGRRSVREEGEDEGHGQQTENNAQILVL